MKEVKIKIYTFLELSEEVQKKLIDNNRYLMVEDNQWYDFIIESYTEKLSNIGFINAEISFSGFHSQGDAASFISGIDINKFTENYTFLKWAVNRDLLWSNLLVYRNTNRYYHYNTCSISDSYDINQSMLHDKTENRIISIIDRNMINLLLDIEVKRVNLCKKIYSGLEDHYKELISDDYIKNDLIDQEIDYSIDGRVY